MEEIRKRGSEQNDIEDDDDKSSAEKRARPSEEGGGEDSGDDVMSWLSMDCDTMSEIMNLLDDTTIHAELEEPVTRVKFIDNPYSSTLIFQSSSSYVTINGNEESCGSSFSDSESSVMVSVDMGGIVNKPVGGAWSTTEEKGGSGLWKGGEMVDCNFNGSDSYDFNVLSRFLMEETVF